MLWINVISKNETPSNPYQDVIFKADCWSRLNLTWLKEINIYESIIMYVRV